MTKLRYSQFSDSIDVDAFEQAIGFDPISTSRGNDVGYCVFPHNHKSGDTTGKFAIHREARIYNCFVCGGGNLLSLAMELRNLDVDAATEWLYQFAHGDARTDGEFADELLKMLEDSTERAATLPYFNERVLERFHDSTDSFHDRGISDEIIARYGLRYDKHCVKPAPMKIGRDGAKHKIDDDYVGPASIWPHYWKGKLVGWQYRWAHWDREHTLTPKWLAKWTNTSDFPKSTTLFNYDEALKASESVVVCESLGTVLFCATHGVPAVAYFGSKPTDEQLRLLRRFAHGVILAPDNDSNMAGDKVLGTARYLERFIPVYIADKVEGDDGADLGDYAYVPDPEVALYEHLTTRTHEAGVEI